MWGLKTSSADENLRRKLIQATREAVKEKTECKKRNSDLIKQRYSVRSYEHAPLPDDKKSALLNYISSIGGEAAWLKNTFCSDRGG